MKIYPTLVTAMTAVNTAVKQNKRVKIARFGGRWYVNIT